MIKYCKINTRIIDVITLLEESGHDGIVAARDEQNKINFVITDGDIRRSLIEGFSLDMEINVILNIKSSDFVYSYTNSKSELNELFHKNPFIRQIPILSQDFRIISKIVHREEIKINRVVKAAIMAGGLGTRLRPYTIQTPKPLLPIKGKPILDYIISWFNKHDVNQFYISVNYLKEKIKEYYKDNQNIKFLEEKNKTGTAGSLQLIEKNEIFDDLILINGDIICDFDLSKAIDFHYHHDAEITMIVKNYSHQIQFGVVKADGLTFKSLVEKPKIEKFINTGIYILKRSCLKHIDREFYNATDLVQKISETFEGKVMVYPISEKWIDLGTVEEYEKVK